MNVVLRWIRGLFSNRKQVHIYKTEVYVHMLYVCTKPPCSFAILQHQRRAILEWLQDRWRKNKRKVALSFIFYKWQRNRGKGRKQKQNTQQHNSFFVAHIVQWVKLMCALGSLYHCSTDTGRSPRWRGSPTSSRFPSPQPVVSTGTGKRKRGHLDRGNVYRERLWIIVWPREREREIIWESRTLENLSIYLDR